MRVHSWTPQRSYGLMGVTKHRDDDGGIYSISGEIHDETLGLVVCSIDFSLGRGTVYCTACAHVGGKRIYAQEERAGVFSEKAISRWVRSRGVAAIIEHAREMGLLE